MTFGTTVQSEFLVLYLNFYTLVAKMVDNYVSIIVNKQHGFVKGHSTVTSLLIYNDYIVTDLDSVDHRHLINKS